VYQKAKAMVREIFEITKSFPKKETYSLTDQVRRSSRSDGEQHETQHWMETAEDCVYISHEKSELLVEKCREVGRLLGSMIDKASLFCNPPVRSIRESEAEYLVD
jgi:hypothetical protein